MVHGFIFGTNLFISSQSSVSYVDEGQRTEFLNIRSFLNLNGKEPSNVLIIDANFNLRDGSPVVIRENALISRTDLRVESHPDRVRIYSREEELPVLDVFQLDKRTYHGFGTHIANELEVRQPDATVTIKANILVAGAEIWVGDDALHVNDQAYASGLSNAHHGVTLSSDGHSY